MSNPRLRRLRLDEERLESRFRDWPLVRVNSLLGMPTERYQITYEVKGLYAMPDGQILERDQHVLEINLSLAYPRRAPQCKMLTPIFHPNFDETSVCIGDFWAASEGLDDLVVRIGRMITFQEYNTKSPLNGLAAKWAAEHARMLPVDHREISPPLAPQDTEIIESIVILLPPEEESAPPMAARLVVGDSIYAMDADEFSIGRGQDNSICISNDTVSTHHAEIFPAGNNFCVRDLDSTNGTWVNEVRIISDTRLRDRDFVRFGHVTCQFILGGE
jgi:ubiquitin-protein ligase